MALACVLLVGACGADEPHPGPALAPSSTTTTTAAPAAPTTSVATTTTAPVDVSTMRQPAAATDPAGLARQIADTEAALRRTDLAEADIAAAALEQQAAYRRLGDHPEWDAAVLAAVPADLRRTVERHAVARRELRALAGHPATDMPAWRIVPPAPADQLVGWYREAEATFGVPWQVLAAVNLIESGLGRIRGTSVAGAQGPMQFLPETWAAYGEGDIDDHRQAIRAAARYLVANGAPADLAGALWNYNHSDHYVRAVQLYADLMVEHSGAFAGFYHWGVWYWSSAGDLYLPVGYEATERIPAEQYAASIE